jgi:ribonuclease HI
MELMAAIKALKHIPAQKDVLIYTDSQYLKNGVESWMKDWKARNWKRKGGKLKNVDLWKQISDEIDQRRIYWRWVKGHNNNPYNERADRLARKMMKKRK